VYGIKKILVVIAFATVAVAQLPGPPLDDSRLTVHTLVREDIFAGFLSDDMERFSRGEKNIDLLLQKRPNEKAGLLAWKAGAVLYRAVRAHENNKADEFRRLYRQAQDLFSQAGQSGPDDGGVAAITGGSYVIFADRLPKEYQAEAWKLSYDSYQTLWKFQASMVEKLPLHLKGELLAGLAQSAQRTGRAQEAEQFLDKIIAGMPGTPYEPIAKQWKKNPEAAANSSLACMTCHDGGRLNARIDALKGK
jgi:hypothetical protein